MQFHGVVSSSLEGDPTAQQSDQISAKEFVEAATRSGRTMQELADLLGVDRSMIYNYRRKGVTRARTIDLVRRKMSLWLRDEDNKPLAGYTVEDLLNELARRFADLESVVDIQDQAFNSAAPGSNSRPAGDGLGRYTGTGGPPEEG